MTAVLIYTPLHYMELGCSKEAFALLHSETLWEFALKGYRQGLQWSVASVTCREVLLPPG